MTVQRRQNDRDRFTRRRSVAVPDYLRHHTIAARRQIGPSRHSVGAILAWICAVYAAPAASRCTAGAASTSSGVVRFAPPAARELAGSISRRGWHRSMLRPCRDGTTEGAHRGTAEHRAHLREVGSPRGDSNSKRGSDSAGYMPHALTLACLINRRSDAQRGVVRVSALRSCRSSCPAHSPVLASPGRRM
jgi:hypothetical protein